jgi:hypothetical protein
LVLPNPAGGMPFLVQGARRNPFDILDHPRNGERKCRPDQRVPRLRDQYLAQK